VGYRCAKGNTKHAYSSAVFAIALPLKGEGEEAVCAIMKGGFYGKR
jgi:hypothetical protein